METGKAQLKKIENVAARKVTFSKRRRGLFKKARELSILCDADVAVIIFSPPGKFLEYSSSSMKEILERYSSISKRLGNVENQENEKDKHSRICRETAARINQLRKMRQEELQGFNIEELQRLEELMEAGLTRVMEKKGEKVREELRDLKSKRALLMEENDRLRRQVSSSQKSGGGDPELENFSNKEGQHAVAS